MAPQAERFCEYKLWDRKVRDNACFRLFYGSDIDISAGRLGGMDVEWISPQDDRNFFFGHSFALCFLRRCGLGPFLCLIFKEKSVKL